MYICICIYIYIYTYIHIYTCVSVCFFANYRPDILILEGCGNGWRRHLAKKKLMKVQITRGHTRLPAKCCQGCRVLRSQEYLTARASQAALLFHVDLTPPDDIVEYCRWLINVYKVFSRSFTGSCIFNHQFYWGHFWGGEDLTYDSIFPSPQNTVEFASAHQTWLAGNSTCSKWFSLSTVYKTYTWGVPTMGYPKSSIWIGFSITKTIHSGIAPWPWNPAIQMLFRGTAGPLPKDLPKRMICEYLTPIS